MVALRKFIFMVGLSVFLPSVFGDVGETLQAIVTGYESYPDVYSLIIFFIAFLSVFTLGANRLAEKTGMEEKSRGSLSLLAVAIAAGGSIGTTLWQRSNFYLITETGPFGFLGFTLLPIVLLIFAFYRQSPDGEKSKSLPFVIAAIVLGLNYVVRSIPGLFERLTMIHTGWNIITIIAWIVLGIGIWFFLRDNTWNRLLERRSFFSNGENPPNDVRSGSGYEGSENKSSHTPASVGGSSVTNGSPSATNGSSSAIKQAAKKALNVDKKKLRRSINKLERNIRKAHSHVTEYKKQIINHNINFGKQDSGKALKNERSMIKILGKLDEEQKSIQGFGGLVSNILSEVEKLSSFGGNKVKLTNLEVLKKYILQAEDNLKKGMKILLTFKKTNLTQNQIGMAVDVISKIDKTLEFLRKASLSAFAEARELITNTEKEA